MKISVCIATYNGEEFIQEQLKSILKQIKKNDEIIISDDYSTDNTIKKIKELNDRRINIFFNEFERGYTKNFENAILKSSGEIIFLSDQDDIWLDKKVEKCLLKLENSDFIVTDAKVIDANLKIITNSLFELVKTKKGLLNNLLYNRYYGCCIAFRRKILKKALPFPKNSELAYHDRWLPIIAEMYYKVELEDTPCILYRRHDRNVSLFNEKSKNSMFAKICMRVYPLLHAVMRFYK